MAGWGYLGGGHRVGASESGKTRTPQQEQAADFSHVLLVNAPGRVGQRGTLIVPWALSGNWGGGLTGPIPRPAQEATVDWAFSVNSAFTDAAGSHSLGTTQAHGESFAQEGPGGSESGSSHTLCGSPNVTVVDSFSETATVPPIWSGIPIVFGSPIDMDLRLSVSVDAVSGNDRIDPDVPTDLQLRSAQAHGDFFHTLRWGGVRQVLDANGQPIANWTLSSDSGTDCARASTMPVPEPANGLSLLTGLLCGCVWRWRRNGAAATAGAELRRATPRA